MELLRHLNDAQFDVAMREAMACQSTTAAVGIILLTYNCHLCLFLSYTHLNNVIYVHFYHMLIFIFVLGFNMCMSC